MTYNALISCAVDDISTHILTKRMTVSFFPFNEAEIFQLTSSRRGWQHILHQLQEVRIFQLTSSRRGWPFILAPHCLQKHFNSHPHEEDDNKCKSEMQGNVYFNSHPHEEDDGFLSAHMEVIYISTHILTKRMTTLLYYNMVLRAEIISTHILTKRMTELVVDHIDGNVFQLTSSRRGWPEEFNEKYDNIIFQLTSSRRGWQKLRQLVNSNLNFNSHPHEEDDGKKVAVTAT